MSAKYGTVYLHRDSIRLIDYKNKFKKTTTTKMAKEDKANKIYEMKKTKKYHVFIASIIQPQNSRKGGKIYSPNTYIHDRSLSRLSTCISIKSGGI
jgi:hypothetical protein